jgi:hypothetical protein
MLSRIEHSSKKIQKTTVSTLFGFLDAETSLVPSIVNSLHSSRRHLTNLATHACSTSLNLAKRLQGVLAINHALHNVCTDKCCHDTPRQANNVISAACVPDRARKRTSCAVCEGAFRRWLSTMLLLACEVRIKLKLIAHTIFIICFYRCMGYELFPQFSAQALSCHLRTCLARRV